MKLTAYLIISSQTGEFRILQRPKAGFGEYVVKLEITIPKPEIPSYTINIPIPATNIKTTSKEIKYGVPWALAEGILEIKSVSPDGQLKLDYTDAGLKRLYDEAKPRPQEGWWGMTEYAQKTWGLPQMYMEVQRWEPLFPKEKADETTQ